MENFSEIFITIKPLFDAVIKKPTQEGILNLNEHLKKVDNNSVQILQNIFLQQLIILVDAVPGQNQNELKTHLLECIITILQKGRLKKAVALKTTLLAALKLIYDKDTGKIRPNLSEEYKLAVLKVLSFASRHIQPELIEEVYVKDNLTLLSQAIFVCVRIVETERARKLRFQAVDAILSLLQVHDDFDFNDIVLRCQVAELLFITLPKLLTIFVSIINGDEKQGTAVYRMAIKALGRTLSLIFEDYSKDTTNDQYCIERFRQLTESFTEKDKNANVLGLGLRADDKIKYFNETTRSREWLLQADKKVEKVLQLILHLRGHEEDLVRLEFAKMNCELLRNCTYNMPCSTVHYLQTVIAMSHDESERVRDICEKCHQSVPFFTISFAGNRIDELFYDTLNQMPRIIYRGEEHEQISNFRLITGFLGFFSEPQLTSIFSCQNILEQFIMVLLAGAELESVDELIRREYVSYRFEYEESFHLQKEKNESRWIVLKNVSSPRARQSFLDLIHTLRMHDQAVNTVLMYILDNFYASRINSNGYLFILSELIPDTIDYSPSQLEPFKTLLSEVLQSHHWFLELDDNENIADQKYNALHVCLVVRTIARIARLMKEHFHWYLYDTLRILLQCCGNTLNCVNESTELALDIVAHSQGLSSIEQLIHHNLDYISQQVTRCLRRKEYFRDGMTILESVLRFVPYETSDVLESTVTPIVMNILDSYSQYGERNSIICLRVLQIFIHSIRLRYEHEETKSPEAANEKASVNLTEQIERLQKLLQREIANEAEDVEFKPDELGEETDHMDEGDEAENETETEANNEEKLPAHVKIVLRILTVNFKHLASSNDAERIVALCTLNEGIYVLQRYENQLLPLVHNIWFNLTERFSDRNPAVVSNAFDLLLTMARLAKDFIRNRSLADVLPKLYTFMKEHWNADASAHQVFKLQCKFLASIDDLVRNLNLSEKQLDNVLEVVRLYWEKAERRELKKRAAECMQRMKTINSLAVFLKCGCKAVLQ
ncbi:TELO2-interacting protein 1 homolog [Anopheles marshallii]|uniref:TELO2-interacting protein 1 homolog n=1 Tax=Anopheles marshallii TaxID=1521116 RepID=UPI00237BD341|nr:TELO2-interacting protein 1 homolog [Anopheles marshallii]